MKIRQFGLVSFVLLAVMAALVFFFLLTRTIDINKHDRTIDILLNLKQLDITLDKDILRLKAFRLAHYDTFVDSSVQIKDLLSQVKSKELGFYRDISDAIDADTDELVKATDEKFGILEKIKSRNAILRNTLRYLPKAVEDYNAQAEDELNQLLSGLLGQLLAYNVFPEQDLNKKIQMSLLAVETWVPGRGEPEELGNIIRHFRASLKSRDDIAILLDRYFDVPTLKIINRLLEQYTRYYAEKTKVSDRFSLMLLVISVFLFAGLGFNLWRLRAETVRSEQARTQLHDAIESISEAFALYDSNDNLVLCNKNYGDFYPEIKDVLRPGVPFEDVARTAAGKGQFSYTEETVEEWVQRRLRQRKSLPKTIVQHLSDGRWLMGSDSQTNDGSIVSVRSDITERKKAEIQLQETKDEAERANQAKSEFLASMSHELRTPLNAILGFAQMMQYNPQTPLTELQTEHVDHIISSGNHLLDLVNEILDLARIEADQINLYLDEIIASDVIDDCISLTLPLGTPRGIQIINNYALSPSFTVNTDHLRLKQVLLNLLSNAVKYNKDGGTVTVEGKVTEEEFLRISVSDTGIGIREQDYSGVFRMFHRLGSNAMVSREGAGIGLSVSKQLVERMGGRIGFDSELGQGTIFWIELPLYSNENVLIWTNALRVGVDAIDRDHQIIVTLLNQVASSSVDDEKLDLIINELIEYTHYHFSREEMIMQVCDFPEFDEHRQKHKELAENVRLLADKWQENHTQDVLEEFRSFLRSWLFNHVIKSDTKIGHYVKGKGAEIRNALETLDR